MAAYDAFYPVVRKKLNLAEKPVMEGFSRGGLPASFWSIRHPDKVAGVYLDAAVMNILSWPREKSTKTWERCLEAWGLDESSAESWKGALDEMQTLVDAGVPVMIVAGGSGSGCSLQREHRTAGEVLSREWWRYYRDCESGSRPSSAFAARSHAGSGMG